MTDKLKHKLYDAFLKDSPIKYDSVTDQQWMNMQQTFLGVSITMSDIFEGVVQALADFLSAGKSNGR